MDYIQKFKAIFLEETSELLNQLEKNLLELEINSQNPEMIEPVFRAMHTLKGTSGMYGFSVVSELMHGLESIFQAIRDRKITFNRFIFDTALDAVDLTRDLLTDENLTGEINKTRYKVLKQNISTVSQGLSESENITAPDSKPVEGYASWQIIVALTEHHYFRGIRLNGIFQDLAALGRFEISRLPQSRKEKTDTWNIILYSDAQENEIREVFIFIEDDCRFIKLTNRNIFEDSLIPNVSDEPSIKEFIEKMKPSDENLTNLNFDKDVISTQKQRTDEFSHKSATRISVDSAKLDHLMFLVSELITLNSQLTLNTSDEKYDKIKPHIERLEGLSMQFRTNALDIRLVPLSESVFRYKRLIRDLSKQLKKEVELITEGVETEVDKGMLDELNDPLMHIIRNCIDHGLEEPEIRIKKGKKPKGIIKISASNSGNYIIIRIEDDGTGIDLDKIRQKAIEKGILKKNDIPSRQELFDMIFLPGFSTAQSLTEISGRGVGMDVVKNKITSLKGEVLIESTEGLGTSFTLKLRQSITIIDTLLFMVDEFYFTIPILDIAHCTELSANEIALRNNTGTCIIDHQIIPFLNLREKLKIRGEYNETIKTIIISYEEKKLSVLADSIIGSHQAVVKPLGNIFQNQKYIGTASQLGDGKLAFMLETKELFQLIQ